MSPRWLLFFVGALAALGLGACRELTTPDSAPAEGRIAVLVLDYEGEPIDNSQVNFTNKGYVPVAEEIEWTGRTGEDGVVYPDIPDGTYSAVVWEQGRYYDRWLEPDIRIQTGSFVLDPRVHMRSFRVRMPDTLNPRDYRLDCEATVPFPERDLWFRNYMQLDESGRGNAPWIMDATHTIDLTGRGTRVRLEDDFLPTSVDTLEFSWEPEEMQIRLTLGGQALPPGELYIDALTSQSEVETFVKTPATVAIYLAASGVGAIRITPLRPLPFMEYEAPFSFQTGETPTVELGDHRIGFRFVNENGTEFFGARLRIEEPNLSGYYNETVADGTHTLFLRSGHYRMSATYSGFEPADLVADLSSDSTFTFVLEPLEP